jgi:WD40 repeat protein
MASHRISSTFECHRHQVWDIRAMRAAPLANLQAHRAPVRSLLVRDGAVWSGSTDGTVRCWDLSHIAPINSPSYEQQQLLEHFIATGTNPGGVQPSFISP